MAGVAGLVTPAVAQERYPSRPVRMILPVGVGGLTDAVGRILAERMGGVLGTPMVPENVVGAGSTLGALALLRSPADGYAIMTVTNNHPVMQALYPNFPYDPVTAFSPIALTTRQAFLLTVHPDVPARDMPTFLAWLRQQKDAVNFGAGTPGTTNNMAAELLKHTMGLEFTIVPYRTSPAAVQDLVAGRVQAMIETPTLMGPLVQAGQLRALAISSAERSDAWPDVPTLRESGVTDFDVTAWQAMLVRPETPPAMQAALRQAAVEVLADPVTKERLSRIGVEIWPDTSPEAATAHMRAEVARWLPLAARMRPG
ncbi:Bug family tripartite tricarboxylate transporter substrate binding protein [Humitalea sp. 24SJ18S-53]|uniref:Bug family tripartite tricarboxylate transporter substrate binding protein n=1 Tax=Humitalea sp. 24SJ18S-53 TaxID=3422307 RepID=UPI003D678D93